MEIFSAATMITLSTLHLECSSLTGLSVGTGFLFAFNFPELGEKLYSIVIITNKHVVEGATNIQTMITLIPKSSADKLDDSYLVPGAEHILLNISNLPSRIVHHPLPNVDLCAIILTDIWEEIRQDRAARHVVVDETWLPDAELQSIIRPIEPIVMVGYPNDLWDKANNLPIVRNGLTASHPLVNWNQEKQFLIDAACFPGSSGSPVFLFEDGMIRLGSGSYSPGSRVALLGILWGGPLFEYEGKIKQQPIPTAVVDTPVISTMMNIGYVVKAEEIIVIKDLIRLMI